MDILATIARAAPQRSWRRLAAALCLAAGFAGSSGAAQANDLVLEANYGRADGRWGAELGAGYTIVEAAGFSLTPGGGVFLRDGGARAYGRVEAAYTLPASLSLGAGVRFSAANTRPYVTLATPLLPRVRLKANVAPKYYTAGLNVRF